MSLYDGSRLEIIQESRITILPKGQQLFLTVKKEKINLMTEDGTENILTGVMNEKPADQKPGEQNG